MMFSESDFFLPKDKLKAFAVVFTMLAEYKYKGLIPATHLCNVGIDLIQSMTEEQKEWARGYLKHNYDIVFEHNKNGIHYLKAKESHPFFKREDILQLIDELLDTPPNTWDVILQDIIEHKDS